VLVDPAQKVKGDLLVVGRVGLDPIIGQLSSVPAMSHAGAKTDVLIVHTTG
jgi:hypothetical protein